MKKIVMTIIIFCMTVSMSMAAGFFTVNGDGTTTISFIYTATTPTVLSVVGDAAHEVWNTNTALQIQGTTFDLLTNQQKVNVVDSYVKLAIINLSKTYKLQTDLAASLISQQVYTLN